MYGAGVREAVAAKYREDVGIAPFEALLRRGDDRENHLVIGYDRYLALADGVVARGGAPHQFRRRPQLHGADQRLPQ